MHGLLGMNDLVGVGLRPRAIHDSQHAPSAGTVRSCNHTDHDTLLWS